MLQVLLAVLHITWPVFAPFWREYRGEHWMVAVLADVALRWTLDMVAPSNPLLGQSRWKKMAPREDKVTNVRTDTSTPSEQGGKIEWSCKISQKSTNVHNSFEKVKLNNTLHLFLCTYPHIGSEAISISWRQHWFKLAGSAESCTILYSLVDVGQG